MTGLGAAPFTNVKHIFYRFEPTGVVLAKEVLEFFGQPVIMNEMRGVYGFAPDGVMMQEKYTTADLGGMKDNKGFAGATATRCARSASPPTARCGSRRRRAARLIRVQEAARRRARQLADGAAAARRGRHGGRAVKRTACVLYGTKNLFALPRRGGSRRGLEQVAALLEAVDVLL